MAVPNPFQEIFNDMYNKHKFIYPVVRDYPYETSGYNVEYIEYYNRNTKDVYKYFTQNDTLLFKRLYNTLCYYHEWDIPLYYGHGIERVMIKTLSVDLDDLNEKQIALVFIIATLKNMNKFVRNYARLIDMSVVLEVLLNHYYFMDYTKDMVITLYFTMCNNVPILANDIVSKIIYENFFSDHEYNRISMYDILANKPQWIVNMYTFFVKDINKINDVRVCAELIKHTKCYDTYVKIITHAIDKIDKDNVHHMIKALMELICYKDFGKEILTYSIDDTRAIGFCMLSLMEKYNIAITDVVYNKTIESNIFYICDLLNIKITANDLIHSRISIPTVYNRILMKHNINWLNTLESEDVVELRLFGLIGSHFALNYSGGFTTDEIVHMCSVEKYINCNYVELCYDIDNTKDIDKYGALIFNKPEITMDKIRFLRRNGYIFKLEDIIKMICSIKMFDKIFDSITSDDDIF